MRNNFLPYLFFLSLTLVPNVHAQTSRSASMPVPFEPFDTGNAVSAEFLKLYKENPKNTAIPADILAILQNQESLEPPTIIRQAPTSAFERTIFSSEAPITGKINSPYQPIINEIVKDPQLLHNIPLDDLNKLILESTQQYATPAKIQNLPQANNFKLLSAPQKSGQPFQNINDLQKLRIVAAKKELSSQEQESRSLSPKKRTDNSSFSNPANETAQNKRQINREELEEKSRQGDENAAILLARSYFYDTGEQKNIDKAFKLLEDLAGKKNTRAMLELGRMYEAGSPRQNVMRSANYYKQAAELGNIDAKYHWVCSITKAGSDKATKPSNTPFTLFVKPRPKTTPPPCMNLPPCTKQEQASAKIWDKQYSYTENPPIQAMPPPSCKWVCFMKTVFSSLKMKPLRRHGTQKRRNKVFPQPNIFWRACTGRVWAFPRIWTKRIFYMKARQIRGLWTPSTIWEFFIC